LKRFQRGPLDRIEAEVARPSPVARGLKRRVRNIKAAAHAGRATFTGRAWIETCPSCDVPPVPVVARPSPVARGLKLQ